MRKALQLVLVALGGVSLTAVAQPGPPGGAPVSISSSGQPYWYQCVANGVTLHYLTPVAYFRGLLGMTPAERQHVLADKSTHEQEQVLAKVHEYEGLPRDVREERLLQTELHWYLLVLVRLDPSSRKERLHEISPLYQPMILGQLARWDQQPADVRQALLEKESFLRTYVEWQSHSFAAQQDALSKLPQDQRVRWSRELERWQALPESKRGELCSTFRRFFVLSEGKRKETVQALSDAERRQMEQTLQSYGNLPPDQQRECLESFRKFATMTPEERDQFLQNAAKWESMSGYERQTWRQLVNRLPPMPPGFYKSKLPPMPPGFPGWKTPPGITNTAQASR